MSEVKVSIEAENLKELLHDFSEALEEMGSIVLRRGEDLPEELEPFLRSKGAFVLLPGHGVSKELVEAIVEEDQEDILDYLLGNEEVCHRVVEILEQEKGYTISRE